MDWSNERYVRLYTRDTVEWQLLPWESRAVWPLILRKLDRAGVLHCGKHGARGVAALIHLPPEVTIAGIAGLVADGCLVERGDCYVAPNFIEAQEAALSDAQRQRDSRERRRSLALAEPVTKRDDGSRDVTLSHTVSRGVTVGHNLSQPVTPSLAEPSEPNQQITTPVRESERVPVLALEPTRATPRPRFDLDALYQRYPRHEGKSAGMKRLTAQIATQADYEALGRAVDAYTAKVRAEGTEARYIKHWGTFAGCWKDYLEATSSTAATSSASAPGFRHESARPYQPPPVVEDDPVRRTKTWTDAVKVAVGRGMSNEDAMAYADDIARRATDARPSA